MEKVEKLNFFSRLKIALVDLEGYVKFLGERFSKCIFFVFKVSLILSILFSIANIAFIFIKYDSVENYIKEKVPEFSVVDGKIVVDEEEKKLDDKKMAVEIIEQTNENLDFNIVKDGYNKSDFINDVNSNLTSILISSFIGIMFANFLELCIYWLVNSLLTSIVGNIVLLFSRIKMKYSGIYILSVYSTTLSTILTVVYSIARMYFDIYIDVFDYLYTVISFIYITAVILMIRVELIKQHMEIIKIVSEKQQNREESIDDRVKEEKEPKENKDKNDDDKEDKDLKEPDGTCN